MCIKRSALYKPLRFATFIQLALILSDYQRLVEVKILDQNVQKLDFCKSGQKKSKKILLSATRPAYSVEFAPPSHPLNALSVSELGTLYSFVRRSLGDGFAGGGLPKTHIFENIAVTR